jgi:PPOX class probable F420-dependent enzyme
VQSPESSLPEGLLTDAKYVSLRSFKKDGQPVDTPVWFAALDGRLIVFTDGTSFKVKRIRRNPEVQIAACDMRGSLRGAWQSCTCRPVENDAAYIARCYDALNQKYGLWMRAGTFFATLAGRVGRRLILEITLREPAQAPASIGA